MNRRNFIRNAGLVSTGLIFVPKLIRAQGMLDAPEAALIMNRRRHATGGGGGSAYSLIISTSTNESNPDISNVTTAKDTTGATLIVLAVACYVSESDGSYTTTVTDSKGNTWTALTQYKPPTTGQRHCIKLFYCFSPICGSGHTFQCTVGSYPEIAMMAFSGGGSHTFDTSTGHGADNTGTSQQPGAITAATSELLVSAGAIASGDNFTAVNSGFTKQESVPTSPNGACAMALAFLSVTSGGSINPTWTIPSNDAGATTMAGFK